MDGKQRQRSNNPYGPNGIRNGIRNATSNKLRLSRYRFVGISLLVILVTRAFLLDSVLESSFEDERALSSAIRCEKNYTSSATGEDLVRSYRDSVSATVEDANDAHTNDTSRKEHTNEPPLTNSENRAFGDVSPDAWRQWLAQHDHSNNTELTVLEAKRHGGEGGGCGTSLQLQFETRSRGWPIPSTTRAFFKISYANASHFGSELHTREIKAYYLDRILQTNVVVPCVGYVLKKEKVAQDDDWSKIAKSVQCPEAGSQTQANTTAKGSMMLWMNGLKGAGLPKNIVQSAKDDRDKKRHEFESAMNYAFFHYLGACLKSDHNHFHKHLERSDGKKEQIYVAIDNDRCLMPKSIYANRATTPETNYQRYHMWQVLVYERICQIPHDRFPVVGVIRQAARSNSAKISTMLKSALEQDALADDHFASQPEALDEVDERVRQLAEYIEQHCPLGGGVAPPTLE